MAVENDIIFLVGCPRSGSTLLNRILREYLDIGCANELQLIPKYYVKLRRYGDLSLKRNLDSLIDDLLLEPYFTGFERIYTKETGRHVKITKRDIVENMPEASFAGVIYATLRVTAIQLRKNRVGNKHLSMGLHLDWLQELFPKCKVIHLIRDGRDCALSLMKMRWGHANAYAAAKFWSKNISKPRAVAEQRLKFRYIEIKYEDFLLNPIQEMKKLKGFVEGGTAEQNSDIFSGRLVSEVKRNNIFKWKESMSSRDISIFQSVAGKELSECGYELLPGRFELGLWQKWCYTLQDRVLREYKVRFRKDLPA